ncbi:hypothetical protein KVP06_07995 [Geobacter sulfurreducens]|uniref:hypothetical protein n=1 Tax=Geobacter sulfurreducens TaxID=35554 RepID=UPI0013E8D076|nr:hypothetical protein [Geobacter sulfurreducens]UAC05888.1 hypothetical protein KVP06_07995 [Geobacter sulfurreducens]
MIFYIIDSDFHRDLLFMVATEATQYKERVPIVKKNEAKGKPPFQAVDSASSIRFHPLLQAISAYHIP